MASRTYRRRATKQEKRCSIHANAHANRLLRYYSYSAPQTSGGIQDLLVATNAGPSFGGEPGDFERLPGLPPVLAVSIRQKQI
jgi:hypothetical protein